MIMLKNWERGTFSPQGKTDPAGHQPSILMSWGKRNAYFIKPFPRLQSQIVKYIGTESNVSAVQAFYLNV